MELVDRLARRGLIKRRRSDSDRREVLLELTPRGDKIVEEIALRHWAEYREMAPDLVVSLKKLIRETQTNNGSRSGRSKASRS